MIRTDDLFLAAFALAKGGELSGVEVEEITGRSLAYFHIDGAGDDTQREYYQGPAVVNLQLLKAAVRRLKDEAFAAIRQEQRRSHAALAHPPRADRRHQVTHRPGRARR